MHSSMIFSRRLAALLPVGLALTMAVHGDAPSTNRAPACVSAAAIDVDGDGRPDRVVLARYADGLWLDVYSPADGSAAPALRSTTRVADDGDAALLAADVNGDGRTDVLVRAAGKTTVWLSNGAAFDELAAAAPFQCG